MKILTRVLSVAIAFSVLAGGAHVYASAKRTTAPPLVAAPTPTLAPTSPAEQPRPPSPPKALDPGNPPAEEPSRAQGKRIEVSIAEQELIAWQDGTVVYRFVISTGKAGYETPKGHWKIHTKYENRWSRKWKVWMPYAMFWHPKWGYAFHELPYKPSSPNKRIGASKLGRADSHGCVRLNLGDAKQLYEWASVGTPVWIH